MRTQSFLGLFALACLPALVWLGPADTSFGAAVDLINSSAGGTSWEVGANWSDGFPAGPGNDYHVGQSPTNRYLRTPNNASNPTFPGDSLTIHSTGTLAFKHNGTVTIDDLRLNGGSVACWVGNRTMSLGGNLLVSAPSTFSMGGTNRRTIQLLSTLTGSGNLNLTGSGSPAEFRLRADTSGYTGQWTVNSSLDRLDVDSGTMNITGGLSLDSFRTGYNTGTGVVNVLDGAVSLGTGSQTIDLGRRTNASTAHTFGTVDFSAAASVTINVANLRLGTIPNVSQEGDTQGVLTLSLAGGNTITAANILVGESRYRGNSSFTSEIHFGGAANTVNADLFQIGGGKSKGMADIAAGGSLQIGSTGQPTDLYVGRNNVGSTGSKVIGTLDLTGGNTFQADLGVFAIGQKGDTSNGRAQGTVTLADNTNIIDAGSIIVGQSGNTGATAAADQSRLHLGGGVNTITTPSLLVADRKTSALIDFATPGGTLNLGTATARTEITLGRKSVSTGANPVGTMDLRDGTANLFASDINLGQETNTAGSGTPTGVIWLGDGSLDVSGNIHENHISGGAGNSTLNVVGTQTFKIGGLIDVDNFRVGYNAVDGSVTAAAGSPFNVGDGNGNFDIGRRATASTSHTHGTVDLGNAASVTIDVANLRLGTITNVPDPGHTQGILTLSQAGANTVTATNITVGESPWRGNTNFTSEINLGGAANAVNVDTMIVGGRKSNGLVDVAAGGSLTVRDKAGTGRADLYIARNNANTSSKVVGTVDLSGGVNFDALLDVLAIGDKGNTQNGKAQGTLILAQTNLIDANSIIVGRSGNTGADQPADQSQFRLGGGINTILTPSLLVGDRKTTGLIDFATPGGTLILGTATARTEITLGRKSVSTANNATGTMDLRDGTATIFASNINLGQETNTGGTGTPAGIIWLGNGSLDVSGNISENHASGGAGSSTINVVGTQTFNVGGYIAVDSFVVGLNGVPGSVSYAGATAQIGTPSSGTDLFVGRRTEDTGTHFSGTLDLSGVTTVNINVGELAVASMDSSVGPAQGRPTGVLRLGQNNTIQADVILIGDSSNVGGPNGTVTFGASNDVTAGLVVVGGNKGTGRADIAGGGTLNLGATSNRADLYVGRQTVWTGGGANGTLDLSGGTFNAFLDDFVIGAKEHATASGPTQGTVTFEAGTVDANSVLLADHNGTQGTTYGTLRMRGGTLIAGSIAQGGGNYEFDWTGGRLTVGTFGFDLLQQEDGAGGGGTLAPGGSPGTTVISGDYDMEAGIYEVEISGLAQGVDPGHDFVDVAGDANLGDDILYQGGADSFLQVLLRDAYLPDLGDTFDVLTAVDVTLGIDFALDQSLSGLVAGGFIHRVIPGGNGEILQLQYVPEPGTLWLVALGLACLAAFGWRRRRRANSQ